MNVYLSSGCDNVTGVLLKLRLLSTILIEEHAKFQVDVREIKMQYYLPKYKYLGFRTSDLESFVSLKCSLFLKCSSFVSNSRHCLLNPGKQL